MIRKLTEKLFLLSLKEIYLSLRNTWGLIVHPYRTLKVIQAEEDYSQIFLLFVTPVLSFLFWAVLFIVVKILLHPVGVVDQATNLLFFSLFTFHFSLLTYLAYWVFFYWRSEKRIKKGVG